MSAQFLSQVLLSISLITTGSALTCYYCRTNLTSGEPSCIPQPITCKNETHCLSMRRRTPEGSEITLKDCASDSKCVSAHEVCLDLSNPKSLNGVEEDDCYAHCCKADLCNLNIHTNESHNIDKRKGPNGAPNGGVSSIPVPIIALMTSLWLMLLNS